MTSTTSVIPERTPRDSPVPTVPTALRPSGESIKTSRNGPTTFIAQVNRKPSHTHVLLITTGSVASIKAPLIVNELLEYQNVLVQVVATNASLSFYRKEDIERLGQVASQVEEDQVEGRVHGVRVWTNDDEWDPDYKIGDPILHIELRRWADIVLIAPCSANTLAKVAGGICDNVVTSLLRALAPTTPTYLFPAMNTLMYEHPLTAHHIETVKNVIKYHVVGPVGKALACGDIGMGAMTEWRDIVDLVVKRFSLVKKAT
ncbi:flavo protein [Coprinopsis marcescibilis]|uniref:Flavo protein n=1 Tax=Coprinopsis marcescibilis TaxID=230819 RepID=A0A5C3KWN4_COPMA|nr:flavo protein [Coprinopsis marcescibilis]